MNGPTERLYFTDSHLTAFSARVVDQRPITGRHGVVLDRTAFYPAGGGQPHDTGVLGSSRVVDVIEEEGEILHVLDGEPPEQGEEVRATIDWPRRFDFMQQHTGQHVLSQAFISVAGAETRGFRMDEESATIDVTLNEPDPEILAKVLSLANSIVFENRAVRIHSATDADLSRFPLRKEPGVEGEIRIVEVADYDWTPCGGTHVANTGEIGAIVMRHCERAKKMTRVEFLCGIRALLDYSRANGSASAVARLLTIGRDDILEKAERLVTENKQLRRQLRELQEQNAEAESRRLFDLAPAANGMRIVIEQVSVIDASILKLLALKTLACGPAIIAFWIESEGRAQIVVGSNKPEIADANSLLQKICKKLGGKGGGNREIAQGGCLAEGLASLADELFRGRVAEMNPAASA